MRSSEGWEGDYEGGVEEKKAKGETMIWAKRERVEREILLLKANRSQSLFLSPIGREERVWGGKRRG